MSDYLTRLIERSLGAAPQIEPLIAPLHAPPGQMLSERTEMIATFDPPAPTKIETSERDPAPGGPARGRTSETAFSRSERQRFRDLPPLAEAPARFPIEKGDDPSESRPRVPLRELSIPPRFEILEPSSVPLPPPMVTPESARAVVQPEITERPAPGAATEGPLRLPQDQSRIVVQPEIIGRRRAPKSSADRGPQPSPNEPPAIHVTIGRVEVHAVMAPSAPPKVASRAAPKLSLKDYLKQPNGGAR
jgi:hypothetical protein